MVKMDLIRSLATRATDKGTVAYTHADVKNILEAYAELVLETLKEDKGEKIPLFGIGNFVVKHVPEKTGTIQLGDKKGQSWVSPEHDQLVFKVSPAVKTI